MWNNQAKKKAAAAHNERSLKLEKARTEKHAGKLSLKPAPKGNAADEKCRSCLFWEQ